MNEEFVPYDLSIKLKEKGFHETCFAQYFPACKKTELRFNNDLNNMYVGAPTIGQVLEWFRRSMGCMWSLPAMLPGICLLFPMFHQREVLIDIILITAVLMMLAHGINMKIAHLLLSGMYLIILFGHENIPDLRQRPV